MISVPSPCLSTGGLLINGKFWKNIKNVQPSDGALWGNRTWCMCMLLSVTYTSGSPLCFHLTPTHFSSLPYWKSEFEELFIFTPRRRVHVRERGMIHRGWHGAADINRILMRCAWDRSEVVREIKAEKRVRTWAALHCYRTCVEKHRDRNNTTPPTPQRPWS